MRRARNIAVVGVWLVMLALLIRKQTPLPAADVSMLPSAAIREHDEWFGVYRDGQKIGYAHRVTSRTDLGYAFRDESTVWLAMLGVPQTIETSLEAETDQEFALQSFRFRLVTPATTFGASGTTDGQRLKVSYGPEGHTQDLSVQLAEPIHLPTTVRPRVLAGDLTPGTRYTLPVFSPLTLKNEPFTVTVDAVEKLANGDKGQIEAVKISEEVQGMTARAWLARDGSVMREEGALGFTLAREQRDQALAGVARQSPPDLAVASQIPLDGRIDDPRHVARLSLRVTGEAASSIPDDPPRQSRQSNLLRISTEQVPDDPALTIESIDLAGLGDPAASRSEYLAPTPFIESDDPAIAATVRAIIANERNAVHAARRLVGWVYDKIEKAPSVTVPSAREVLKSRRGDCNEHAVLLTALARAAGIPSRMVVGVVYAEGGFYYHAWNEFWLDGWVSADAVWNQLPVDATHVKLATGNPTEQLALARVIGKLAFAKTEN